MTTRNLNLPPILDVEGRSVREVIAIFFTHKWLMLSVWLGVILAAVFAFFYFISPTYESKSTILIDPSDLVLPVAKTTPPSDLDKLTNFHAQTDILDSDMLATRVVDRLDLADHRALSRWEALKLRFKDLRRPVGEWLGFESWTRAHDARAASIEAFSDGLKVEPNVDSRAIELSYHARSPEEAAASLNALVEEYQHYFQQLVDKRAAGVVVYLENQIDKINQDLTQAEQELLELRRRDVMKLDVIGDANLRAGTSGSRQRRSGGLTLTGLADSAETQTRIKLYLLSLEDEARKLALEYQPNDARVKNLRRKLRRYSRSLAAIPRRELGQQRVRRMLQLHQEVFTLLRKNLEHARMIQAKNSRELDATSVIEPATENLSPVSPAKWTSLGVCCLFGLLLAAACALVSDYFDHTIHNARQLIQYLGLRTLGSLERLRSRTEHQGDDGSHVRQLVPPGTDPMLSSLLLSRPSQRLFDALDSERFVSFGDRPTSMLVLSSEPAEGATSVALLFAARSAAARPGKSVLLIDTSIGENPIARRLGLPSAPGGLGSVLAGDAAPEDAIVPSGMLGLDVLPAGEQGAPFTAPAFERLLKRVQQSYDLVVVDSPPARQSRHGISLAKVVRNVVLVLRCARTNREQLQSLRASLERVDARVLGAVLNFRNYPLPRWLYDLA